MDIAVSTPGNKFAFQHAPDNPTTIEATELTNEQQQVDFYNYETFSGYWDVDVAWEEQSFTPRN